MTAARPRGRVPAFKTMAHEGRESSDLVSKIQKNDSGPKPRQPSKPQVRGLEGVKLAISKKPLSCTRKEATVERSWGKAKRVNRRPSPRGVRSRGEQERNREVSRQKAFYPSPTESGRTGGHEATKRLGSSVGNMHLTCKNVIS
jgi:hypothetical protein